MFHLLIFPQCLFLPFELVGIIHIFAYVSEKAHACHIEDLPSEHSSTLHKDVVG